MYYRDIIIGDRLLKYLDGYIDCFMLIHESEKTNIKEKIRSVYMHISLII